MAAGKTHPHIESPSEGDLARLVAGRPLAIQQVYLDAHRLVLEAVPEVRHAVDCVDLQIGYGARQFGYDGWGMAAVTPYTEWVTLTFVRGAALEDPDGLLEGAAPKMRHVKLRSPEQLIERRDAIKRLLQAAVHLNQR